MGWLGLQLGRGCVRLLASGPGGRAAELPVLVPDLQQCASCAAWRARASTAMHAVGHRCVHHKQILVLLQWQRALHRGSTAQRPCIRHVSHAADVPSQLPCWCTGATASRLHECRCRCVPHQLICGVLQRQCAVCRASSKQRPGSGPLSDDSDVPHILHENIAQPSAIAACAHHSQHEGELRCEWSIATQRSSSSKRCSCIDT